MNKSIILKASHHFRFALSMSKVWMKQFQIVDICRVVLLWGFLSGVPVLDSEPASILLSWGGRSIHHWMLQFARQMIHWQLTDVGQFYRPKWSPVLPWAWCCWVEWDAPKVMRCWTLHILSLLWSCYISFTRHICKKVDFWVSTQLVKHWYWTADLQSPSVSIW